MPVLKATEIKLWILWKEGVWRDFNLQFYTNRKHRIKKKNSIGVSQISKILIGCHNSFSNKALGMWGLNEELRREGQCDAQKQYFGARDYSHTRIITEMSHPTLYSKRWLWWHDLHPAPDHRKGVLLGILGGGVVPGSPNPDIIADHKIVIVHTRFQARSLKSIPIFGPGLI